ncbi:MAG: hypothetical protein ACJAYH_002763 [Celeribacter sp.]|jgi:hypothetical protein
MHKTALALHGLLTLEHVHDFDRPEAAYFAELDPEMPYIEEICLLTDGLTDALWETASCPMDSQKHTSRIMNSKL